MDSVVTVETASTHLVNGVFKGGGAKGLAYAGALRALEERGGCFDAVAGASAGAITATLVAAGFSAKDVEECVDDALKTLVSPLPIRLAKAALGFTTSLFDSRGLRVWINKQLAARAKAKGVAIAGEHMTFAELYTLSNIELYVVVMDIATGSPIVFTRRTTPDLEVAAAVCSSCTIPAAFSPGRVVLNDSSNGAVVHQLVDGGSWANYPTFVFKDPSFREWLWELAQSRGFDSDLEKQAWAAENSQPVVGFLLGDPEPLEGRAPTRMLSDDSAKAVNRRFDAGPTYTSPSKATFTFGALFSSDYARMFIAAAIAAWLVLSVASFPLALRRLLSLGRHLPNVLYPIVTVGVTCLLVLAAATVFVALIALIALSRILADTLIPSGQAAMGVATEVAPWVGKAKGDLAVRVPHPGLDTTEFNVADTTQKTAIAAAYASVAQQLDQLMASGRITLSPATVTAPSVPAAPPPLAPLTTSDHAKRMSMAAVALAAISVSAWLAANRIPSGGVWHAAFYAAVLFIGASVGLWYMAGRAHMVASRRARAGLMAGQTIARRGVAIAGIAGLIAVAGGLVLGAAAMNDRDGTTQWAKVVSAEQLPDGTLEYKLRDTSDSTPPLQELTSTKRHLRLGEVVLTTDSGATPAIARPFDGIRFPISLALIIGGLGLITSAVKLNAFARRCATLSKLVP